MSSYRPRKTVEDLGDAFYDVVRPARFPKELLRFRNQRAAETVGLHPLTEAEWQSHFAKFQPLADNLAAPLALRYHGHQFDVYNPHLGDGRGFLFAQLEDEKGRLLDLGTKGSGTTPWSRGGDGRLTLKGGIREVLATEMLEARGVPTSRSFSLFETGEALMRGDEPSPTRSSVLVRLSHSHVRFGTFQRLATIRDEANLGRLLDYCIRHYYPELGAAEGEERATAFLEAVTKKSAVLVASWMVAGFVHGVLNSDNMNITGESFDYGPYRFLPTYDPEFTAAYFDGNGLYRFDHQPRAVFRNLLRLGESLRPIAPSLALGDATSAFERVLSEEVTKRVLARLSLVSNPDIDEALTSAVFTFLAARPELGYDQLFFDLRGGKRANDGDDTAYRGDAWQELASLLALYSPREGFEPLPGALPCTLLIDEIEEIWSAIDERDDFGPFERKVAAIREMGARERLTSP